MRIKILAKTGATTQSAVKKIKTTQNAKTARNAMRSTPRKCGAPELTEQPKQ
jgi:hypothetical protein